MRDEERHKSPERKKKKKRQNGREASVLEQEERREGKEGEERPRSTPSPSLSLGNVPKGSSFLSITPHTLGTRGSLVVLQNRINLSRQSRAKRGRKAGRSEEVERERRRRGTGDDVVSDETSSSL